jgi:hypothetical protein
MISEAQTREGWSVKVGWSFHDILQGFQAFWALRWMMAGMSLGEVASRSGFTCHLSLPMWRASLPSAPAYDS